MVCSESRILDHAQRLAQRSIICSLKIFGGTLGSKASEGPLELCFCLETSGTCVFGAGVDLSLMLATEPNARRLNAAIVGRRSGFAALLPSLKSSVRPASGLEDHLCEISIGAL